jgi:hypothetical protein
MIGTPLGASVARTTSPKVVVPFYVYAAVSFLAGTVLLLLSTDAIPGHWFQPRLLALTHVMALGWATMIILGAGHQLFPVLIEADLWSEPLARVTFWLAALGIPLLVHGFFTFNLGWSAQLGGSMVVGAVLAFLVNMGMSISGSKHENVHAVFVFTSAVWLLLTASLGLALLFNFTSGVLPHNSLHYLALHAHMGIVGWFLLLVLGVGSRLIPLFLISKYHDPRLLWAVFLLVNTALLGHVVIFLLGGSTALANLAVWLVVAALLLFAWYCRQAYVERIRRKVDDPMRVALLSVGLMLLPSLLLLLLMAGLLVLRGGPQPGVLLYGFTIFFGWLTALILGMTFKTLPFIVWNRVYSPKTFIGKMPGPKDLFSNAIFRGMAVAYLAGFTSFAAGILAPSPLLLNIGAVLLLTAALAYNWNVAKLVMKKSERP